MKNPHLKIESDLFLRRMCPACGTNTNRDHAKFCLDCGKRISEDYQPLDSIRSSYGLQQSDLTIKPDREDRMADLFAQNRNPVSDTAWACVVYSLVPYLGILFVPLAFATAGFGYAVSYRKEQFGERKMPALYLGLSVFILAVQIFLWWLLYIIPEVGI